MFICGFVPFHLRELNLIRPVLLIISQCFISNFAFCFLKFFQKKISEHAMLFFLVSQWRWSSLLEVKTTRLPLSASSLGLILTPLAATKPCFFLRRWNRHLGKLWLSELGIQLFSYTDHWALLQIADQIRWHQPASDKVLCSLHQGILTGIINIKFSFPVRFLANKFILVIALFISIALAFKSKIVFSSGTPEF